jgi:hypothetical protein
MSFPVVAFDQFCGSGAGIGDFFSGLRIHIHFIRIRIQHFRLNTNPDPDPIRFQGFNDQKLKKNTAEKKIYFFLSKTAIYLSLGLHKVCPSYRRSLQLSKEAIQHFGSTDPIESGSNPDPQPCFFLPRERIRDKLSTFQIPDPTHISENLVTIFGLRTLKFG